MTPRIKFVLDRIKKLCWVREMYIAGKLDTAAIDHEIAVLRAEIGGDDAIMENDMKLRDCYGLPKE